MFVSRSKYDAMQLRAIEAESTLYVAREQWNQLVRRINKLGGEEFLRRAKIPTKEPAPQFTLDEVERLIRLCHPDKHNQSIASNAATQKLLALRKTLEGP